MGWSRQLGSVTVDEASGVAKRACEGDASLVGGDVEMLKRALVMAKAGIEAMGGTADVWIGGGDKVHEDDKKQRFQQITISATVTVNVPIVVAPIA